MLRWASDLRQQVRMRVFFGAARSDIAFSHIALCVSFLQSHDGDDGRVTYYICIHLHDE